MAAPKENKQHTCKYFKFDGEGKLVCSECAKPSEKYEKRQQEQAVKKAANS